jgi:hypothetical protein
VRCTPQARAPTSTPAITAQRRDSWFSSLHTLSSCCPDDYYEKRAPSGDQEPVTFERAETVQRGKLTVSRPITAKPMLDLESNCLRAVVRNRGTTRTCLCAVGSQLQARRKTLADHRLLFLSPLANNTRACASQEPNGAEWPPRGFCQFGELRRNLIVPEMRTDVQMDD